MFKSTIFIFAIMLSVSVFAQEKPFTSTQNKKADKLFNQALENFTLQNYGEAVNLCKKALDLDVNYIDAHMLLADLYEKNEQDEKAQELYAKLVNVNPNFPLSYLGLASYMYAVGNYDSAQININKFVQFPDWFARKPVGLKLKKNIDFAVEAKKSPVPYKPINLGPNVNSIYDDYFPVLTADRQTLLFTRNIGDRRTGNEDFYVSKITGENYSKAKSIGAPINSDKNEGTASISADGQYIFYTYCGDIERSCDLLLSVLDGAEWSEPRNLGAPVNTRSWETQPSVSFNGKTVYFASERPGGFGGSDIWMTTYANGRWSPPMNLGPEINTEGEEQYPFIALDDKTLYFVSNGHPGMGGLDIFSSKRSSNGRWQAPKNIGYPINTNLDEQSFSITSDGVNAFISSAKNGGFGGLDIYQFELYKDARPEKTGYVKGVVYDAVKKNKLAAKLELIDLETKKIVIESRSNKTTGEFLLSLQGNKNYALNVSLAGYMFYSENFSLKDQTSVNPLFLDVPLIPIADGATVVLKNIFFETAKFDLKTESTTELDKLVQFLQVNPKLKIEIGGHTDNQGKKQDNITLSNNRAKAVYDYLVANKIEAARLTYKGYADSKPIVDNLTEANRSKNRRTEFKIIK
jgi:outer membrane protein OmpA-like peptidoglycan-associated protein/tetratricopeptide (TPR) repeat protein